MRRGGVVLVEECHNPIPSSNPIPNPTQEYYKALGAGTPNPDPNRSPSSNPSRALALALPLALP